MHPISRKNSKVDPYGRRRAAWVFDSISHFTIRSHIMDFKEFYEQRKKLSQVFRISQAPQSEGPTRSQFWPIKSIFVHRKLTGYFGIDFMLRLKLGSDFVQGCVLFCLFKDKRVFLGLFDPKMKSNIYTMLQESPWRRFFWANQFFFENFFHQKFNRQWAENS